MGLLAALLWGGTDFLVGLNVRAVGVKRAVFFSQSLGFTLMSLLLVIFPAILYKATAAPAQVWLMGVVAAAFTVCGALALGKAFALGKASIVAPLVTSYGVVTTLLSWASGEQISLLQLMCILLCVIGVILSSLHSDPKLPHSTAAGRSIFFALLSALLYGTSFWLQGRYTLPQLGPISMLWLGYAVGSGVMLLHGAQSRRRTEDPAAEELWPAGLHQSDEPRRFLRLFLGSHERLGVGGDGDQHPVRRHRRGAGLCVLQGAADGGASDRRGAGVAGGVGVAPEGVKRTAIRSP